MGETLSGSHALTPTGMQSTIVCLLSLTVTVLAGGGAQEFTLVKLPNAKCIDGSPAAYYIARNSSSTRWVVWLEGGGICESLADCQHRARTTLGSSATYRKHIDAPKGMLSSDPAINPDLHSWNRIYVPYCSGDIWSGTIKQPLNPFPQSDGSWTGYFQGHTILEDIHAHISMTDNAAATATHAVLTGCSAGGIGTILNCDWFASQFPSADSACRPEAGWFGLEQTSYPYFASGQEDPDPRKLATSNWTVNVEPYAFQAAATLRCAADVTSGKLSFDHCEGQKLGAEWCCNSPPTVYAYSTTRMFISENTADAYQVFASGQCPPQSATCAASITHTQETSFWDYIRGTIAGSLTKHVINDGTKSGDGLFAPACLQHCMPKWQGVTLQGKNDQQAFGDWYFRRSSHNIRLDNNTSPDALCKCAETAGGSNVSYDRCSHLPWY